MACDGILSDLSTRATVLFPDGAFYLCERYFCKPSGVFGSEFVRNVVFVSGVLVEFVPPISRRRLVDSSRAIECLDRSLLQHG